MSDDKKKKQPRRNEKHQRYMQLLNSPRWWREVRVAQLRKHPLCQMCEKEGIIASAVDVHHIEPVQSFPMDRMEEKCYDPKNLISLCVPCHIKIHKQMGSRHDLKAPPAPKDEQHREWLKKWAGEETLREMDERDEMRRTRKLPRWLQTKTQKQDSDRKAHEEWEKKMQSRFNNGLQGTDATPGLDAPPED